MTLVPFDVAGVFVDLAPVGDSRDDRLRQTVGRALGVPATTVLVTRVCQRCGSADHGQPRVAGAYVSVARSRGYELCGLGLAGPIGVDLESVSRVVAAAADAVFLHRAERDWLEGSSRPDYDRATLWAAKEAVLKATGYGLAVAPSELSLEPRDADALTVAASPPWLGVAGAIVRIRPVSDDLVAALAVLA